MHYIQKHILDELRVNDCLHYAKINKDEIESGHFRYHLKQLIKDGYILQQQRGIYSLSIKGQQLVDKLSDKKVVASKMPKVITYTLLTGNNLVFLYKKQKQPYMGLLNMVGGKVHEGESTSQASAREVLEKTGLTIQPAELKGVFDVMIYSNQLLLTHAIAFVYIAQVNIDQVASQPLLGIPINKLLQTEGLAPDFLPIFNVVSSSKSLTAENLLISY